MNKKQILKLIITIVVSFTLYSGWIFDGLNSIIVNNLAMKQLENTTDSSLWIQWYTTFNDNKILIIIALVALLYTKEIKQIFTRKGENTNEKEN